jgi:hypothetical protein
MGILRLIQIISFAFMVIIALYAIFQIGAKNKKKDEKIDNIPSQQAQDMYNNGQCPLCSSKIDANSIRCFNCMESLFDYAQGAKKQ